MHYNELKAETKERRRPTHNSRIKTMTSLTIRATTLDAELDAIPFLDMRREATERRDDAKAVQPEQGDQIVLEYIEYPDGVAVLYSAAFDYAYVNQHSPGVGDSLLINSGDASSVEAAADIYRRVMSRPTLYTVARMCEEAMASAEAAADFYRAVKNLPTLYTVARSDGENREYNLTVHEAARAILQHDGGDYEIRPRADGEGFDLWTRKQVANIPWGRLSHSLEKSEDAAEAEIFQRIVDASGLYGWPGLVATRQDDYLAMLERMRSDYDPVEDADEIAGIDAELAEIEG